MPCTCLVIAWLASEPRGVSHEDIRLNEYLSVQTVRLCENYKMWGINGTHFIHYRLALFFQLLLQCLQGGSVFKSCFFFLLLPHFSHTVD